MPSLGSEAAPAAKAVRRHQMTYQQHFEAAPDVGVVTNFQPDTVPAADAVRPVLDRLRISLHDDLASIEEDWRRFEAEADCTVFQTFAWQSSWQRHIGAVTGSRPAIVIVRAAGGGIVMLAPFAIEAGGAGRR